MFDVAHLSVSQRKMKNKQTSHSNIHSFFLATVKSWGWFMMQISADKVKVCFVCQTVCGHCSGICFFFYKQYMQMLFTGISHPTQWASCLHVTWCDALLCCSNRLCIWISFLWLTQSQKSEMSCIKSKQRSACLITWRSLHSTFSIPATDRGLVTVGIITLFSGSLNSSPKNKNCVITYSPTSTWVAPYEC